MKSFPHLAGLVAAIVLTGLLTGCASIGAPVPPSLELPKPPTDLRAVRKGDRVYLFWNPPTQATDRQNLRHPGPIRICRSLQAVMSQCEMPVGNLAPAASASPATSSWPREAAKRSGWAASFVDLLPKDLQQGNPTQMVTYAVEALNLHARSAGLSNQVHVPLAPTLSPPRDPQAQVTPEGVVLTWAGEVVSNPPPQVEYVYRVYRRTEGTSDRTVIGQVPVGSNQHLKLVDTTFAWEKTYEYWLTTVTQIRPGTRHPCPNPDRPPADCADVIELEGDDTPVLKVFVHDVFPPGVPSGLQAVFSGPGQAPFVDLLWAPDTDADLAGYNVYRGEQGSPPVKINAELVKTPAYRDRKVVADKTYRYSVSALDLRGNESARSEETSESVPPNP
jgi:hypothetical protein